MGFIIQNDIYSICKSGINFEGLTFYSLANFIVILEDDTSIYFDEKYAVISDNVSIENDDFNKSALNLFIKYGPDGFGFINGSFSIAIIDINSEKCYLATDWTGTGTLFKLSSLNEQVFASNIGLIKEHPKFHKEIDLISLKSFILFGGEYASNNTIYENLIRFLPSEYYILSSRNCEKRLYSLSFNSSIIKPAENYFKEKFSNVVKDYFNTKSLVEISGGLDSSSIASLINEFSNGFSSISYYSEISGEEYDERRFQNSLFKKIDSRNYQINVDNYFKDFSFSDFKNDIPYQPCLSIIYGQHLRNFTKTLYTKFGLTSCISGSGGDQLFCGDSYPPIYLSNLLKSFRFKTFYAHIRAWSNLYSFKYLLKLSLTKTTNPISVESLYSGVFDFPKWFVIDKNDLEIIRERIYEPQIKNKDSANEYYLKTIQLMGFYLGNSLSSRVQFAQVKFPLLDKRLVELLISLPWEYRLKPNMDRCIQRSALKNILPDSIRLRRDKGGASRPELLYINKYWHSIKEFIGGSELKKYNLIDYSTFQNSLNKMKYGFVGIQYEYPKLLAAINAELWLQMINEEPSYDRILRFLKTNYNQ